MSDEENIAAGGDAGSSLVYPMQAGNIKKGAYAMLKGNPCKVNEMTTSKAGKHGHAKATIVGTDIFTGKKYEDSCPTSHNMEIPFVKKNEYQLIDIAADDYVTLLLDNGETKEDLKLPTDDDELVSKLRADFAGDKDILLSVISAMGQEKIVSYREASGAKSWIATSLSYALRKPVELSAEKLIFSILFLSLIFDVYE